MRRRNSRRADDPGLSEPEAQSAIRQRAYEIYFNRRGINGDALSDWLQAEREFEVHRRAEWRAREARLCAGSELAGSPD